MTQQDTRPALSIRDAEFDGERSLELAGELDLATVQQLIDAARPLLEARPERLVFDLRALRFCDSSGLRSIKHLEEEARAAGTRLVLVGARPNLRRIFDIVHFGEIVEIDE